MIVVLTWKSAIKWAIWPGWSSLVKALLFLLHVHYYEWCIVMCMSTSLSCMVRLVCEMNISIIGVKCFRHAVWEMMEPVCHIQMCHCWTLCCHCSCSVVGSQYMFSFQINNCVAVDYYDLAFHLIYLGTPFQVGVWAFLTQSKRVLIVLYIYC